MRPAEQRVARLVDGGGGVGRAELAGHLELERVRVDRDHGRGAGVACALDGVDPDAADPEDHDRLARTRLAGADRRAPAGRHAAPDEARHLERDVVVDPHARVLRHDGVVGERAERAEAAEVLAVLVEAEGLVLEAADARVQPAIAQVLMAGRAIAALPARRDVGGHDVIARRHASHAGAHGLDDPRALVTAHQRKADVAAALAADVLVRVTQAGRLVADQHLELLGLVEV